MNIEKTTKEIVDWLYNYCEYHNLKSLIVGLSGGIDSAVIAKLCEKVSQKSNNKIKVFCAYIYKKDNLDSRKRAEKLANQMNVTFSVYNINKILYNI